VHATIAALNIYPVKSCRGIAADRADMTRDGLAIEGARDREWMIIDARGRFVTQRELPRLALVGTKAVNGRIQLHVPGLEPVMPEQQGPVRNVVVWSAHVRGRDGGDAVAVALSTYLGHDVRLVRFDDSSPRPVNPHYAGASGATTLYADGYPLLVIGQASLDELNERLASRGLAKLPMNRFRPNVVVEGLDPYDEDHIDTLAIGDVVLKLVKPCTRCEITTTDQDTARRSQEPLRTLSTYRRDDRLAGVTFGMNAIVAQGAGSAIAVGDDAQATIKF
jgi:uncharacterized protein YcbX